MTQEPEGVVTVLFTDIVGSAALKTAQGDAAAQDLVRAHFDLLRHQVDTHRGREIKTLGDGLMATFVSPRNAVACAIGMQRALADGNRARPDDQQLQLRVGLNSGEAIREDGDLFGSTVDAAARICAKASGGQILTSETVRGVVGATKDIQFADRGRFRLKGFPDRWRLVEVVWQEETPAARAPVLAERTPFVGREGERGELGRLLEQAIGGRGALVMLGGEPGVGKTRLCEELMAEARQRNVTALMGRCYEMEGASPYIPFVEMVEAAARMFPPEALRDALGDSAPEVARLVPELRRLFPDIPPSPELPPEQERRYLFNGVREFLGRAGSAQPLLLVLDDLHWADDATMLLVQHIAQGLPQMPILAVGTYRDVELEVARPLSRALEELVRRRLAHDLSVKRLPQDGVAAMLRALSGQDPPAPLVQVIYGETEGNCFFVEEVAKHLAEEGKLFGAQGRWRADLEVSALEVPRGVRLVISRRLERVSKECRRVLTTAAVIGRAFSFDLLEALGDVEADGLLDAVDEAERALLITSAANGAAETGASLGEARLTFVHELIRQTLISGVSLPRRQRLHLRVAEAIERVYGRILEEHAADLAYHLQRAGSTADPEKTVHYLKLAGDRAMAQVAWEAAAGHYERALESMDLIASPDERVRVDVLLAMGRALETGGADRARWRAAFQRAAEIARGAGDYDRYARAALAFASRLPIPGVVDADVVRMLEEALQLLGPADSALRAMVLARLGNELTFSEQGERKEKLLADALQVARRLDDPETLAYVLSNVGWENRDAAQGLSLAREQVEAARRAGDKYAELRAHNNLAARIYILGDRAGFDQAVDEEDRLLRELRIVDGWTDCHHALQARMDGRFEEAERLAGQVFAELQPYEPEIAAQTYGIIIFEIRRLQGRLLEMEPAIKANAERYPALPAWRAALAGIYSSEGRQEDARAPFNVLAERGFAHLPSDALLPSTLSFLAEACWSLGDAARAPELYDMLLPHDGECVIIGWANTAAGAVSRSLALLAATMRRWEDAERHFEDAIRTNAQLGDKPWLAHTRAQYARMLIDRDGPGDRDKAFRLLTEAIAMYRKIGMPKHLEMAEAMLAEC